MSNELAHYGILGMKWGVRRPIGPDGLVVTSKRTANKEFRAANRQVKSDRKKAVKRRRLISDDELQSRITRLEKEKKLKELTAEDLKPGRKAVKSIMSDSGQKTAKTAVSGAMLLAIKTALTGQFNIVDAAAYVAPKPKK